MSVCSKMRRRDICLAYADVIVRRWQEATGEAAVLEGEDRVFADIAAMRGVVDHDVIQTAET
jgi:hypothetical protein